MSSGAVRTAVESRIAQAGLSIPLLKTADERAAAATLPNLWMTALYTIDSREPLTMGSRPYFEELGTVTVIVFSRTGQQGAPALAAAQSLRAFFEDYSPSTALAFMSVTGPLEPDPAAEGEFYPVQLLVNYSFNERPL